MNTTASHTVTWSEVHAYVAPVLARVGHYPMIGTPDWRRLPDDDPAKLAAVFDAAQHWALYVEGRQIAMADASKAIAAAADWAQIARETQQLRSAARIPRRVA